MSSPTSAGGKFRMNEGDWVCVDSQCGNVNFARRTSCNRCGKEKAEVPKKKKLGTEIGKAAADKSGGLFSADDWQCSKCGNVNWARRQSCNMCNAPKFGEVEERTGYGGGFNERENVEYVERDDSDGEYDEFGRKKKKFRGKPGSSPDSESRAEIKPKEIVKPKAAAVVAPVADDEDEEEEEDDDDDDDGDLSKYDLTGWGEEEGDADDASKSNNEKDGAGSKFSSSSGARKKSRSRSRSPSSTSKGSHSSKGSRSPAGGGSSSNRRRRTSRSRSRSDSGDSKSHRPHRRDSSRSKSDSKSRDRSRSRSRS